MKKIIFLWFFTILTTSIFAQDIDLYGNKKNDNFVLPPASSKMNLDEFQILSRTFRMQDMMYASIVPGYVHFKAKDFNVGYAVLGVRSAAYATFAYQAFWTKSTLTDSTLFSNLRNYSSLSDDLKTNTLILLGALSVIGSSYLFDIIHGKYRLEKKQENIRYKYTMKASLTAFNVPNSSKSNYGIGLCFYF